VPTKSSRQIFLQNHHVEKKGRKMQFSTVIFVFTLAAVFAELTLHKDKHNHEFELHEVEPKLELELHEVEPKLELELHEVFVPKLKEPPLVIVRKLYKDPTDCYQENQKFS
jgi:hypothetical protein